MGMTARTSRHILHSYDSTARNH